MKSATFRDVIKPATEMLSSHPRSKRVESPLPRNNQIRRQGEKFFRKFTTYQSKKHHLLGNPIAFDTPDRASCMTPQLTDLIIRMCEIKLALHTQSCCALASNSVYVESKLIEKCTVSLPETLSCLVVPITMMEGGSRSCRR